MGVTGVGRCLTFPAFCKAFSYLEDLDGKFPGRYEDDCACTKGMGMTSTKALYQGDHVRESLSRTGASHADKIARRSGKKGGNGCTLDWGRSAITLKSERTEQLRMETCVCVSGQMAVGVVYRPMLWKLPPPTSPFAFPLLFIFLSRCVPPLTSLFAIASCMNSPSPSSSSSSSLFSWLNRSCMFRVPVKAEAMSRSSSSGDLFRLRCAIGDAPELAGCGNM